MFATRLCRWLRPGHGGRPRWRSSGRRASSPSTWPTAARSGRATRSRPSTSPVALVRGDGFYLDRYRHEVFKDWPNPGMPYLRADGRWALRLALSGRPGDRGAPVYACRRSSARPDPSGLGDDAIRSGSTRSPSARRPRSRRWPRSRSWPCCSSWAWGARRGSRQLAAALGSNLWCTASQTLWQHGPAALMLTLVVLLLWPESPSRLRFFLAGLAAGAFGLLRVRSISRSRS